MGRWPRLKISGWMIGIAAVAVLLAVLPRHPGSIVLVVLLAMYVGSFFLSRPSYRGERSGPRPGPARRLQFSIWQIMAFSVFAAGCSILARINLTSGVLAFGLFGAAGLVILHIARLHSDDSQERRPPSSLPNT